MKRKLITSSLGVLAAVVLLYASLVTLHANTPHSCPKHGPKSSTCSHVTDPDDTHGPGESSANQKKKQKQRDVGDIMGCGCFWDCLFGGAF